MLQFQAQELRLHFAYLREVCLHVLVPRLVYLVGEVDEELRVASDGKALHPQSCRGLQASYEAFVFCDIVGDLLAVLKTELHGVVKLVLSGRDEHYSSPRALVREGAIEIHDPAVWSLAPWGGGPVFSFLKSRGVCPFCHKIGERGSLDDPGSAELQWECL